MIVSQSEMTVGELIEALQQQPLDAPVRFLYDGFCLAEIRAVWTSNDGETIINDGDVVSDYGARPVNAPSKADAPYWKPVPNLDDLI